MRREIRASRRQRRGANGDDDGGDEESVRHCYVNRTQGAPPLAVGGESGAAAPSITCELMRLTR